MAALAIMSIVLMVNRFRTNLMGDEGYVTFTLPVSSHQIVWSKIIVSTVWFIVTGIVEAFAPLVCFFDLDIMRNIFSSEFFHRFFQALHELVAEYGLNVPAIAIELIVLCLLSCAVLCLNLCGHGRGPQLRKSQGCSERAVLLRVPVCRSVYKRPAF